MQWLCGGDSIRGGVVCLRDGDDGAEAIYGNHNSSSTRSEQLRYGNARGFSRYRTKEMVGRLVLFMDESYSHFQLFADRASLLSYIVLYHHPWPSAASYECVVPDLRAATAQKFCIGQCVPSGHCLSLHPCSSN